MAEPSIIKVAERECADVVPLYYPMAKAAAHTISPDALYEGMVAAWTGGNIGEISNSITKIWASPNPDIDAVKILCFENNFVIDYAKTLYKPTRPKEWDKRLHDAVRGKVPSFFQFAKGKLERQVATRGSGVVDSLHEHIQIYKFKFNASSLGTFDYRMLMYDENVPYGEKEQKMVREFRKASASMGSAGAGSLHDEDSRYWLQIKELRKKTLQNGSRQYVVDVLVRGLFHEHKVRKKSAFWECFGDVVLENLQNNLPEKTKLCRGCGCRFRVDGPGEYCTTCKPTPVNEVRDATCVVCGSAFKTRDELSGAVCPACKMSRISMDMPTKSCVDCGTPFTYMPGRGRPSVRCAICQKERNRQKTRDWKIYSHK